MVCERVSTSRWSLFGSTLIHAEVALQRVHVSIVILPNSLRQWPSARRTAEGLHRLGCVSLPNVCSRPVSWVNSRAGEGNRTPDLLITNEPLCRLSYPGLENRL